VLLNNVCKELSIPVIATEQNPSRLGATVPELVLDAPAFAKTKFSMYTEEVSGALTALGSERKSVLLVGIEAHVCVLQTVLDLLENNYDVCVVCDAVSSQRPHDRAVALERIKAAGATLTTSESAVFDLLRDANHPKFKTISGMLKLANEAPNEFASDGIA